jgi:hypothetical protein
VKKFFLARTLIEVDVTNRPDFDERQAADYFSSVFSLYGNDRKLEVTVRELRPKASYVRDVDIEEYEYRGFVITICAECGYSRHRRTLPIMQSSLSRTPRVVALCGTIHSS